MTQAGRGGAASGCCVSVNKCECECECGCHAVIHTLALMIECSFRQLKVTPTDCIVRPSAPAAQIDQIDFATDLMGMCSARAKEKATCVQACVCEKGRPILVQGLAGLSHWQLNLYLTNTLTASLSHTHTYTQRLHTSWGVAV